ncbi:hypothetical protein B0A55_04540 [Friedmanniomyces simplex]|uniref:Uncharacterized protein n=1 Tax=Friedmanniomyces simplex TaxID=329884 RepID=A0A4U0XQG7_9PEZI|nr:hypothetical protein B0A55_04540 [Friedmanniomyces simplex]
MGWCYADDCVRPQCIKVHRGNYLRRKLDGTAYFFQSCNPAGCRVLEYDNPEDYKNRDFPRRGSGLPNGIIALNNVNVDGFLPHEGLTDTQMLKWQANMLIAKKRAVNKPGASEEIAQLEHYVARRHNGCPGIDNFAVFQVDMAMSIQYVSIPSAISWEQSKALVGGRRTKWADADDDPAQSSKAATVDE